MMQFITGLLKRNKPKEEETTGSFLNKKPKYVYGHITRKQGYSTTKIRARLNNENGNYESVLWNAGQQGHTEDYWHKMGAGHEKTFVADSEKA